MLEFDYALMIFTWINDAPTVIAGYEARFYDTAETCLARKDYLETYLRSISGFPDFVARCMTPETLDMTVDAMKEILYSRNTESY